ncbi:MAG TPA: hypothetical protein VK045_01985 [Ornithinicoccus sp.]|nr:hypothetical protein [Ornithinicoccus sp.]
MRTQYAKGWVAVRREDGELIGFVAQDDAGWRPLTVFGHPLSDGGDRAEAEDRLHGVGMSYLAEHWQLREGDDWIRVQLVEVSPVRVRVQVTDYGQLDRYGEVQTLTVPVTGRLRMERTTR